MRLLRVTPDHDAPLPLSAFLQQVQGTLEYHFPDQYWILAEIGQIQRNRHCYLTLTESNGQELVAQVRATIWQYQLQMLHDFEEETGETLKAGMKVLLRAKVSFHAQYGLSLQITDLDAGFTLGELALRRRQIMARLQKEGLMGLNKKRVLPLLVQRIAVISSPTAAGYEDFLNQLLHNASGHQAYVKLFPATMQGAEAEASIRRSLRKVAAVHTYFDVVVIIRGGGSSIDLECFNTYGIAKAIAEHPLPVLSGIGHLRDESIADLVAFGAHKTPTAVAEFLVSHLYNFESLLEDIGHQVAVLSQGHLSQRQQRLADLQSRFERHTRQKLQTQRDRLQKLQVGFQGGALAGTARRSQQLSSLQLHLQYTAQALLNRHQSHLTTVGTALKALQSSLVPPRLQQLAQLEQLVQAYDPRTLMKRGYSITYADGQIVKSKNQLAPGALLYTELLDGGLVSQVVTARRQGKAAKTKKTNSNGNQLQIDLFGSD